MNLDFLAILATGVFILPVSGLLLSIWFFYQNNRTYTDRNKIIEVVYADHDDPYRWRKLSKDFDRVDYFTHLWSRAF